MEFETPLDQRHRHRRIIRGIQFTDNYGQALLSQRPYGFARLGPSAHFFFDSVFFSLSPADFVCFRVAVDLLIATSLAGS